MAQCTFVTYSGLPDLDPDDKQALDVLAERGYQCQYAIWDDSNVNWREAGVTVIRSTWDYHRKYEKFQSWVKSVSHETTILNAPSYIFWNSHKSYLRDLSAHGISVVPTQWLNFGSKVDVATELKKAIDQCAIGKLVVKPAIGLATSGVMVVEQDNFDAGVLHVRGLLDTGDVMVQPFVDSVQEHGENALVFINGRYCHAARKTAFQALAAAGGAGETPVEATTKEVELAESALNVVAEIIRKREFDLSGEEVYLPPPLYARVDMVRDDRGLPMIIELELVEPSLFLSFYPASTQFFVDAIEHVIQRTVLQKA